MLKYNNLYFKYLFFYQIIEHKEVTINADTAIKVISITAKVTILKMLFPSRF